MPFHECKICNYQTSRSYNLTLHNQSSKHQKLVHKLAQQSIERSNKNHIESMIDDEEILKCIYCGQMFANKTNKYRHQKHFCKIKLESDAYDRIKELEEQNKKMVLEKDILLDVVKTTSSASQKSISTLSYVMTNMKDAPPMELLNGETLTGLLTYANDPSKKLEEVIIHYHNKKLLHQFLGDLIIHTFKKDNPCDQSFWSSDVSRLSFVVKQVIEETNESEWVSDKGGKKIINLIIIPILNEVKEMLKVYVKECSEFIESYDIKKDGEFIGRLKLSEMHYCNEIIMQINLRTIGQSVLKYIAPFFNINITKK